MLSMKTEEGKRPDFEKMAQYTIDDGFTVKPYYELNEAYAVGANRVWDDFVIPLERRIKELEAASQFRSVSSESSEEQEDVIFQYRTFQTQWIDCDVTVYQEYRATGDGETRILYTRKPSSPSKESKEIFSVEDMRAKLITFADWYDKLSPTQKVSVWSKNGEHQGMFSMDSEQLVDIFLRKEK